MLSYTDVLMSHLQSLAFARMSMGWWQMSEEARRALELAAVEDPGEALCVPLSLGELRTDRDHSGQTCIVLDIVFNTDVLKQAQSYR